jgi:hypothetical protein
MKRITTIAIVLAAAACNRGSAHQADKAAAKVIDKTDQVNDSKEDIAKGQLGESKDLAKNAGEQAAAENDFEMKRQIRVDVLRAEHALVAAQPVLISSLATQTALTEAGRADVNEKLQILMMRLDETGNAITGLQTVDAQSWKDRDDEASRAMSRLDDARDAAFNALRTAPRTDQSS